MAIFRDNIMHSKQSPQFVLSIQYLRAIAALLVVIHHARNPKPWFFNPMATYDAAANGVELFFVISGFVMYVAARRERPLEFASKRICRIVPPYWLATLTQIGLTKLSHGARFTLGILVTSFLFIPYRNWEGNVWPILVPGWTLTYEVFFYVIFFVGLLAGRPMAISSISLLLLSVLGRLFDPKSAALQTYTSPILLEFAAGNIIGWLYARQRVPRLPWLLPIGMVALLSPFILRLSAISLLLSSSTTVLGTLALEKSGRLPKSPFFILLGDASYSLYLTHLFVIVWLQGVWERLPLTGWLQFTSFISASLTLAVGVGVAVHLTIERPLYRLLRRTMLPSRAMSRDPSKQS